jgi:hypothetical protein
MTATSLSVWYHACSQQDLEGVPREPQDAEIPQFRGDGYLPEGLYVLRWRRPWFASDRRLPGGDGLPRDSRTRESDGRRRGLVEIEL